MRFATLLAGVVIAAPLASVHAEPLTIAGAGVEVTLSEVSARTARLDILAVNDPGPLRPASGSAVLVPFQQAEKLRVRDTADLPAGRVAVGSMTVSLRADPLRIEFQAAGGRTVQQLAFRQSDWSFSFDTPGLRFGMGGGRQQFVRRGF